MNGADLHWRLHSLITGCWGSRNRQLIDPGIAIPAAAYSCPLYDRSAAHEIEQIVKSLKRCSDCGQECDMLIVPPQVVLDIALKAQQRGD